MSALSSPIGVTHRFVYEEQKTTVYDADHNQTMYSWDDHLHLNAIYRCEGDVCNHSEHFLWGASGDAFENHLLSRSFCDEQGQLIFCRNFSYDDLGNVLEENFSGNLSGQDERSEFHSKKFLYSQDGRNLVLREEEGSKVILYDYLPETHLQVSKLTCDTSQIKLREFYDYNEQNILIRHIIDDGTSSNKSDLGGVGTRKIQEIAPYTQAPYLGMPWIVEEKYWDGVKEVLLKKSIFTYTTGQDCQGEIFDAAGNFCYALTWKYDSLGRVIEETNRLKQTAFYKYDEVGNKIFSQDFSGASSTYMQYDNAGRLLEEKQVGLDGKEHIVSHAYDHKHSRIATTDYLGNTTRFVYDPFGNCRETRFPPLKMNPQEAISPVLYRSYDASSNIVMERSPNGGTTITCYTAYNKPCRTEHADGSNEEGSTIWMALCTGIRPGKDGNILHLRFSAKGDIQNNFQKRGNFR